MTITGTRGETYVLSGLTREGVSESIEYALTNGGKDDFTVRGGTLPGTFRGTAYGWRVLCY